MLRGAIGNAAAATLADGSAVVEGVIPTDEVRARVEPVLGPGWFVVRGVLVD